ncbi:hypothetical protein OLMES_5181 [Oleiphilus messinensis]|uniref:Lipoprotein n=2 Tax=Oleiphilus messinensis TaxID=141451 RepID=A0A1Y0II24_9GAMM|nr:hypothetical protein OLMES_5181 [Oleiphilus messinensis]
MGLTACSDQRIDCPPVVDTTEIVATNSTLGTQYFLVRRISGWHDKTVIFQVFDGKPQLDACNQDLIVPLYEDSVESGNVSIITFNRTELSFVVEYQDDWDGQTLLRVE